MFISLSSAIARFGGMRIGAGFRITRKNAWFGYLILMFIYMFQLMWYTMILAGWLLYLIYYGMFIGIRKFVYWIRARRASRQNEEQVSQGYADQ